MKRLILKITVMIIVPIILIGCTYTITQVQTDGKADDVVDETSSATPTTTLTIPVKAIP
jgi:hypothetical protein